MATRSNIRVVLKEEDRDREMYFDPMLIGNDSNGQYKISLNEWGNEQLSIAQSLWEHVNPAGAEALRIYHHWDGYPEGVGETLINEYNTYEKALNLVLGGDCSTINRAYSPYALRKSEDWDTIKPQLITEDCGISEEYDYMFKDGEWFVRSSYDKRCKKWTLVSKILASDENI